MVWNTNILIESSLLSIGNLQNKYYLQGSKKLEIVKMKEPLSHTTLRGAKSNIKVIRLCPRVPVHKGIAIVFSLLRSLWLTVMYCLVFCIGPCVPVHKDMYRTSN